MKSNLSILLILAILCHCSNVLAQGKVDDYRRAWNLRGEYDRLAKNLDIHPRAIPGTHSFTFSLQVGDSTELLTIDAETNSVSKENHSPSANNGRRGYGRPQFGRRNGSGKPTWHQQQHHWMEVDPENDLCGETWLPNGSVLSWKDGNLWIMTDSVNERQLTTDGKPTCYYSIHAQMSPDGRYLATTEIIPAPIHNVTWVESSPRNQVQPRYLTHQYTKPGDSLNYRIPVIIELESGKTSVPSTELFSSQYEVSAPVWDRNSKTVTFEFNERGHKTFRVLEMDVNANVRTLIEEKDDKYVAYSRNYRHDFGDGRRILWKSERDGHAHLYIYDRERNDGGLQVTNGDFWVRDVIRVDEENGKVWFTANGMNKDEDPYFIHYYRINLDGSGLTELTPEEGTHKAVFTSDMQYLIDTYSTVETPPVALLRSGEDGSVIREIARADISRLKKTKWSAPEPFMAKGRDGKTDIWGVIQRPSNFNPKKKYPVIEYIYSGPGGQYVPKSFSTWHYNLAGLAELGFIVVQIDGMSTSFRTKDFEQICYRNLKDAGLPDHIAWLKAAAEKYPYMDIERMGIYGSSAGGQNALGALLFHGDFYKAGYAACGCHDNRMDKIWWNEQWMGYPVDEAYSECSNVDNAYRLQGKLMLVVGEMDDNVDPSSTLQVVNALIKADKDFELIYLPGVNHTMGEAYGEHKRFDFFVKELLGVEPPEWNKFK